MLLYTGHHVAQSLQLSFRKVISRSFEKEKKHRKGSFLEKLQCFALESAFSHHPANLNYATGQEGPHTIVFISAKLPHACVV